METLKRDKNCVPKCRSTRDSKKNQKAGRKQMYSGIEPIQMCAHPGWEGWEERTDGGSADAVKTCSKHGETLSVPKNCVILMILQISLRSWWESSRSKKKMRAVRDAVWLESSKCNRAARPGRLPKNTGVWVGCGKSNLKKKYNPPKHSRHFFVKWAFKPRCCSVVCCSLCSLNCSLLPVWDGSQEDCWVVFGCFRIGLCCTEPECDGFPLPKWSALTLQSSDVDMHRVGLQNGNTHTKKWRNHQRVVSSATLGCVALQFSVSLHWCSWSPLYDSACSSFFFTLDTGTITI